MLIRAVLLFTGLEVRTELSLDSAAARGICRREGVGIIRHVSTKVLWPQQLVNRGVVTVGACSSAENRADFGTQTLPVHKLRQVTQWNGLVLDLRRVRKRMNKTRESSGELQCKQSLILNQETEEAWKHQGLSDGYSWD